MSDVAALIVNWNSGPLIGAAIRSILSTSESEIVVVDNASSDGSLDAVDRSEPRIRIFRNDENLGFAAGINRGFRETRSTYVLILNPDARARPGAIAALKSVLDRNARAGAVGGYVNSRYMPRSLPTMGSLIRENLGLGRGAPPVPNGLVRVDQPAGSALMVRRDAYDAVNGFDEQFYPAWYEDVDFAKSLAVSGWEVYFDPAAAFEHDGGYSLEALGVERFMVAYYANQFRYARKHLNARFVPALKAALLVGVAARSLIRPHRAGGYLRGLRQVMVA